MVYEHENIAPETDGKTSMEKRILDTHIQTKMILPDMKNSTQLPFTIQI